MKLKIKFKKKKSPTEKKKEERWLVKKDKFLKTQSVLTMLKKKLTRSPKAKKRRTYK
jgi:hypothetical protein